MSIFNFLTSPRLHRHCVRSREMMCSICSSSALTEKYVSMFFLSFSDLEINLHIHDDYNKKIIYRFVFGHRNNIKNAFHMRPRAARYSRYTTYHKFHKFCFRTLNVSFLFGSLTASLSSHLLRAIFKYCRFWLESFEKMYVLSFSWIGLLHRLRQTK